MKVETGEGAFCPRPVCPIPVAIPPTAQCNGKSLRKELARGGGCEHIGSRDRGGGFCPLPVCPIPVGIPPTVQCNGKSLREELVQGWGM